MHADKTACKTTYITTRLGGLDKTARLNARLKIIILYEINSWVSICINTRR